MLTVGFDTSVRVSLNIFAMRVCATAEASDRRMEKERERERERERESTENLQTEGQIKCEIVNIQGRYFAQHI